MKEQIQQFVLVKQREDVDFNPPDWLLLLKLRGNVSSVVETSLNPAAREN